MYCVIWWLLGIHPLVICNRHVLCDVDRADKLWKLEYSQLDVALYRKIGCGYSLWQNNTPKRNESFVWRCGMWHLDIGKASKGLYSHARLDASLSFHLSSKSNYCFFFWHSHVFRLTFFLLLFRYALRLVFDTLWDFLGPSEAFTRSRHHTNEPTRSNKTTKTNETTAPARYGNLFIVSTSICKAQVWIPSDPEMFSACFLHLVTCKSDCTAPANIIFVTCVSCSSTCSSLDRY